MTETCFSNWVQSHIFCFVWPKWWLSQTYNLLPYNVPKYSIKYHSLSLGKVNVENIMESAWLWQCNIYTRGDTNVAALNKSSISLGKYFSGDRACNYGKSYRPETWHDCLHVYLWRVYQILLIFTVDWIKFCYASTVKTSNTVCTSIDLWEHDSFWPAFSYWELILRLKDHPCMTK